MGFLRHLPVIGSWPVARQLDALSTRREQPGDDPLALGPAARSARSDRLHARTRDADAVVKSVCPYCAVGCGQKV